MLSLRLCIFSVNYRISGRYIVLWVVINLKRFDMVICEPFFEGCTARPWQLRESSCHNWGKFWDREVNGNELRLRASISRSRFNHSRRIGLRNGRKSSVRCGVKNLNLLVE